MAEDDFESAFLDLADVDLRTVLAMPDSVLRASLERALTETPEMPDHYAAFQSSL
jgi:FXSXX-COOH protein